MAIVSNQEHRKLLYQCMCSIQEARSLLDKKAKEVAFNLLKELDLQKVRYLRHVFHKAKANVSFSPKNRRQKQSKRRRNKRLKRREQKTLNSYDDEDAEENQDQGDAGQRVRSFFELISCPSIEPLQFLTFAKPSLFYLDKTFCLFILHCLCFDYEQVYDVSLSSCYLNTTTSGQLVMCSRKIILSFRFR